MKLIVGLGNPGKKYENTRHNAGFMVMDRIAELCDTPINKQKFEGRYVKTKIRGEDVVLLKPETYMNLSGFSVRAAMDFFKIPREDILVIYDDLDTPVGSIRLKTKGSAGGHNGMKSVISSVLGEDFNRIRVGIGRDPKIRIIDYVLTKFRADEVEDLNRAVDQAAKAALFSLNHTFEQTMNRYNVKVKKPKPKPEKKAEETYVTNQDASVYTAGSSESGKNPDTPEQNEQASAESENPIHPYENQKSETSSYSVESESGIELTLVSDSSKQAM